MSTTAESVDYFVKSYGELVFDLCESLLWNHTNAQEAFRMIIQKVYSQRKSEKYSKYEKGWVLRIACLTLLDVYPRFGHRISSKEQLKLDSSGSTADRLREFESYFHRLDPEDQLLLLLRDKFALPYQEIEIAMASPEGALKIRRQQALRALEDWLWNGK